MRLILTTIILTILAQPVLASNTEDLLRYCSKWKEISYASTFNIDEVGTEIAVCIGYMSAMRDVGKQNCAWENLDIPDVLRWAASPQQLAQHFINQAEKHPEDWELNPYNVLAEGNSYYIFVCKK